MCGATLQKALTTHSTASIFTCTCLCEHMLHVYVGPSRPELQAVGPDTVPFRPISHPTQACLHGALHHFFFQNFNMDTQLKITHYYPNLELNNITAK